MLDKLRLHRELLRRKGLAAVESGSSGSIGSVGLLSSPIYCGQGTHSALVKAQLSS